MTGTKPDNFANALEAETGGTAPVATDGPGKLGRSSPQAASFGGNRMSEANRHELAMIASAHLPPSPEWFVDDADIVAMRAAFKKRFDEPIPRTETLFAVAAIGYRIAIRDHSNGDW